VIGGVVEEAMRKGKVAGSKSATCDFDGDGRANSRWSFPVLKSFFFLFLKTDFLFSGKTFLQAVGITEPPVEMHFHRRFLVTACRNVPFLLASSAGGAVKRQ